MGLGYAWVQERDARVEELCADVDDEAHGCAVLGKVCVRVCCPDPPTPRGSRACVFWVLVRVNDPRSRSQGQSAAEQALKCALRRRAARSSAGASTNGGSWATAQPAVALRR